MKMFFKMTAIPFSILRAQCPNCVIFRSYATRKRFYRSTGIIQNDSKWEVRLDHRRLKTPGGKVLQIDSEPLARAIAAEWEAQNDVINQATMHLTALCNTAVDNPGRLTSHDIANYLLDFLPTDTLLFHSDEEEELRSVQEREWGGVVEWFEQRFGVKQPVSRGLDVPPVATETRAVIARHLLSYDFPTLSALSFGVEALKSLILMLACVERRLTPHEAVLLARLEEEYQVRHWGRVQWAHELNQVELTARVAAALLAIQCRLEYHSAKAKTPQREQSAQ